MKKIIGLLVAAIVCIGIAFGMNQAHKQGLANNDASLEQGSDSLTKAQDNENKADSVEDKDNSKEKAKENSIESSQSNESSKESAQSTNKDTSSGKDEKNTLSNSGSEESKNETQKKEGLSKPSSDNNSSNNASVNEDKKGTVITEPEKKETVTISINAKKAIDYGIRKEDGFSHLPANGVILGTTKVDIKDGYNVFDVLAKVVRDKKIQMEYTGAGSSIYIQGIDNLYEFDCGKYSGWMYEVNGVYPNYGVGAYTLKPGDKITFNYTCDLGKDLGAPVGN